MVGRTSAARAASSGVAGSGGIPVKAKILAVAMMSVSLAILIFYGGGGWIFPAAVGAIMVGAAAYVISRPNA